MFTIVLSLSLARPTHHTPSLIDALPLRTIGTGSLTRKSQLRADGRVLATWLKPVKNKSRNTCNIFLVFI